MAILFCDVYCYIINLYLADNIHDCVICIETSILRMWPSQLLFC